MQIGYYAQNQSDVLTSNKTLLETMEDYSPPEMRTRLRAILGAFLFSGDDATKKVSVLSGGERARLALACMLLRPFNLLVLDEPTNHLDMRSKDMLKQALMDYDGTMIVVSHDRDFLAGLTNRTVEFRDRHLHNYIGDVNAFLEKRALDNMRDVEMRTINNNNTNKNVSKESDADKKRLQRAIQNVERKIQDLEKNIAQTEKQMAETDFYSNPKSSDILAKHKQFRQEMEAAMQEWEEAQMALDGIA